MDRWPLGALRMLGAPLETFHSNMQLAFVPRGARAVGVKLVGSGEQPASCSGETSCDNGLLHKLQRVLLPPMQGWQGFVGRGEARQKMQQADLEVARWKSSTALHDATWNIYVKSLLRWSAEKNPRKSGSIPHSAHSGLSRCEFLGTACGTVYMQVYNGRVMKNGFQQINRLRGFVLMLTHPS